MWDYEHSSRYENDKFIFITDAPWGGYPVETIKRVIIDKGITYIGSHAFYFCSNITGDLVILSPGSCSISEISPDSSPGSSVGLSSPTSPIPSPGWL